MIQVKVESSDVLMRLLKKILDGKAKIQLKSDKDLTYRFACRPIIPTLDLVGLDDLLKKYLPEYGFQPTLVYPKKGSRDFGIRIQNVGVVV